MPDRHDTRLCCVLLFPTVWIAIPQSALPVEWGGIPFSDSSDPPSFSKRDTSSEWIRPAFEYKYTQLIPQSTENSADSEPHSSLETEVLVALS